MATDGVQRIIAEIEKSTEAAVSAALAEARAKADEVLGDARKAAAAEEQAIVARGQQEAQRESQRILAEARIKARREKVRAQEDVVQKAFAQAREELVQAAEAGQAKGVDYRAALERLIVESAVSAGVADLEVLVAPRDRAALTPEKLAAVAAKAGQSLGAAVALRLAEETLECMGGVVVRSGEGTVRVENTFESRIERFRDAIRTRVAQELFPRES